MKISFEDEKREALVKLEDDLKTHYQKSLSIQNESLRHELNSAKGKKIRLLTVPKELKEKEVNSLTRELAEKSAEIKELQTSLDEIKNDYVELSRQNTNSESENLSKTINAELQGKVERAETALKNIELENAALLRRIQTNTQSKCNSCISGQFISFFRWRRRAQKASCSRKRTVGQRKASSRKQIATCIDAFLEKQQSNALNEIAEYNPDFHAARRLSRRICEAAIAVQFRQAQVHRNTHKSQIGMQ